MTMTRRRSLTLMYASYCLMPCLIRPLNLSLRVNKIMRHSKRKDLRPSDVDGALSKMIHNPLKQYDQLEPSKMPTLDEENKDVEMSPINAKVEIEWINLGSKSGIIDSDKRYLYNWYRNIFKLESLQSMEENKIQYPFPDIGEKNRISENILQFILYKIRSEQFALPKCMAM